MKNDAIIIFVNNPVTRNLKTKAGSFISEKEVIALYRQLLLHTYNITFKCEADKFVFYDRFIIEDELWSDDHSFKFVQSGNNTGEKILHAFNTVFEEGYSKVVFIGIDSIELETMQIDKAFNYLNHYDVIIGPVKESTYYLIAMKKLQESLFNNKAWESSVLLEQTLNDITEQHLSYHLLDVLTEVEEEKDLYLLHHRQ